MLNISHYVLRTKVLGPYLRSAVWVSGCCFSCKGCIAADMNNQTYEKKNVGELADIFLSVDHAEGITVSGGEPFLQAKPLAYMLRSIKEKRDYGAIIYTGFTLEELRGKESKEVNALLDMTDILIDGRYRAELDDGKPFRGSSNQRIILLTDRYKNVYDDYYLKHEKRDIEIILEREHIYMVGVPSEYGLKTWKDLKKRAEGNVE